MFTSPLTVSITRPYLSDAFDVGFFVMFTLIDSYSLGARQQSSAAETVLAGGSPYASYAYTSKVLTGNVGLPIFFVRMFV